MNKVIIRLVDTLDELADKADVIAVAGENRYVNGQYVPTAAEVMHAMRDNIRTLKRQVDLEADDAEHRRHWAENQLAEHLNLPRS